MPTIGIYIMPDFDLPAIENRFYRAKPLIPSGEKKFKRQTFSEYLGFQKVVSSSHYISSLKLYGFIETGNEEITITERGELILYGNDEEKRRAKEQAINNLRLISDLQARYGVEPSDAQIRAFLKDVANVPLANLQNAVEQVAKFLNNHKEYIRRNGMKPITMSQDLISKSDDPEENLNTIVNNTEWEEISFKNIKVSWKGKEFDDAKTLTSALEKLLELWFQLNKPDKHREENAVKEDK